MIYRSPLIKFLNLEKLAKYFGLELYIPKKQNIDWLLVNDLSTFNSLNLNNHQLKLLKKDIKSAHSIFVEQGFFVYAIESSLPLNKKQFNNYLPKIIELNSMVFN